ncbi:MAG: hypothetical protein Q9225_002354 [Loekoesia sp. 1 TL-2023]
MVPGSKKSPTAAEVKFGPLKNCLVNLPVSLIDIIATTNVPAQDVVIEILIEGSLQPVEDGKAGQRSVYVGWSGMPSTQKSPAPYRHGYGFAGKEAEKAIVEIDATFARMLALSEGQTVGLLLHIHPPSAHAVHIEPLTPSDWEVIELHANFLELNLLSQIRALPNPSALESPSMQARHAHPLTLHLSPTSTANVIVTSLIPSLASSVPFAKLAPDAEVIVAPKTRSRLSERGGVRSIDSTGRRSAGGRSAQNGGRRHAVSDEHHAKKTLLLRPCDRKFCNQAFDAEDTEIQNNAGLRIWVDSEVLEGSGWAGVTHVSVSIVKPAGFGPAADAQQQQKKKDLASNDTGKPAASVVAKLVSWYNAPGPSHAALSSLLCSSLQAYGIVGGMVKVEVAPPPISKHAIQSLIIMPLAGNDQENESIRVGGHSQAERTKTLKDFEGYFGSQSSDTTRGFFRGPLTEGLLVPPMEVEDPQFPWRGGILRFVWPPPSKVEFEAASIDWVEELNLDTTVQIGNEITNPLRSAASLADDSIPNQVAPMTGIEELHNGLFSHLSHSSSVLLTGGLGSGKSSLVKLMASQLRSRYHTNVSYMPCRKLVIDEVRISTVKDSIERHLAAASWAMRLGGQSLVILDDLDKLCPVVTELQTQDNSRSNQISELLCNVTRRYCTKTSGLTILATAQSQDLLNSLLVGANLFKDFVNLKAPDKDRRRRLLEEMVGNNGIQKRPFDSMNGHGWKGYTADQAGWVDNSLPSSPAKSSTESVVMGKHLELLEVAGQTDGYMPADLTLLVWRARSEALIRAVVSGQEIHSDLDVTLTRQDFNLALKGFVPASLRNVTLQSSKVTFDSIGGLRTTRETILETLQYPTLYAPIFAHCPLRLRSGLLLYGYPGCGKTLLASAVAGECGLNFISVKGPEILNKYIGASEKSVRDLFERAESARPCVLFFDEFDSIAPKRGHDSTGVTDRVVNQLLTQMDGAEGLSGVYVLAATSRPDLIDPALLRPGRLDKSILCDLPAFDDRLDILGVISKKLKMDPRILFSGPQSLHEVAQRTEGYSGADLQAVVYNAHLEAIHNELGDHKTNDKVEKKSKGAKNGRLSTWSDILQFRFGKEANAEAGQAGVNRTEEIAKYHAIVIKLRDLRQTRRVERQNLPEPSFETFEHGTRNGEQGGKGMQEIVIQWRHIEASLASTRSSISPQEQERLRRLYKEFVVGRSGDLPNGEGSTEVGGRSSLM